MGSVCAHHVCGLIAILRHGRSRQASLQGLVTVAVFASEFNGTSALYRIYPDCYGLLWLPLAVWTQDMQFVGVRKLVAEGQLRLHFLAQPVHLLVFLAAGMVQQPPPSAARVCGLNALPS